MDRLNVRQFNGEANGKLTIKTDDVKGIDGSIAIEDTNGNNTAVIDFAGATITAGLTKPDVSVSGVTTVAQLITALDAAGIIVEVA